METTVKPRKERKIAKILSKYEDSITGLSDLCGDKHPSVLFYLLAGTLPHLLSNNTDDVVSAKSMAVRRYLNPIIKKLGPLFLANRQVFESKNALLGIDEKDKPLELDKESVIWCGNHCFKDDILATVLSARHSYILFGSLPMFFNSLDGITAYLNGVILCNRKSKASRQSTVEKCSCLL